MKNKGLIIAILIVFVGVGGYFAWQKKANIPIENNKEVVKIGVILPLANTELAPYGKGLYEGIELAFKQISNDKIELIKPFENNSGKNIKTINAYNKLITNQRLVAVIGPMTSGNSEAIAPLASRNKVVVFSPAASSTSLSRFDKYFFRMWNSDDLDGQVAAEYVLNELKVNKVAIIYENNDYCIGLKDVFKKEFKSKKQHLVSVNGYQEATNYNFRSLILQLKKSNVDAVYIPGHPKGIVSFLKQSKELDFTPHIISNVSIENREFIDIAGDLANGIYYTAPSTQIDSTNLEYSKFKNLFLKEYGKTPDLFNIKGYEVATVLINSILKGNAETGTEISNYIITKQEFDLVEGNVKFKKNGDILIGKIDVKKIVNGSPETVKSVPVNIKR